MSNFAPDINDNPIDPTDARFFYGLDFVDVVDDGGTLVNPTAVIDAAGIAAGITLNSVQMANTSQVIFKPTVSGGEQTDVRWNGNGKKYVVTVTIDNASAETIERSGKLWFAQR